MPLAAGTRLGPFEIVAPIGKGGMGEVYRARDTKLGRDVAIKVLPGEFANDDERLARFEREAKLLARYLDRDARRRADARAAPPEPGIGVQSCLFA